MDDSNEIKSLTVDKSNLHRLPATRVGVKLYDVAVTGVCMVIACYWYCRDIVNTFSVFIIFQYFIIFPLFLKDFIAFSDQQVPGTVSVIHKNNPKGIPSVIQGRAEERMFDVIVYDKRNQPYHTG